MVEGDEHDDIESRAGALGIVWTVRFAFVKAKI